MALRMMKYAMPEQDPKVRAHNFDEVAWDMMKKQLLRKPADV